MTEYGTAVRTGRRRITVAAVMVMVAAFVAGTAGTASAAANTGTFAGHCTLQGTTHFSPAITPVPGAAMLTTGASGTCTGILNGRAISGRAVSMSWRAPVYADGCLAAHTTAMGPGVLVFGNGAVIDFTAGFSGVLTEYALTIRGQSSGTASGLADLATTRTNPLTVSTRCAGLDGGLAQTPVDITFATVSPLVNGAPATSSAFTGTCQLSGDVVFQPALTTTAQRGSVTVAGSGSCTGTIAEPDGSTRSLSSSSATVTGGSSGSESCESGIGDGTATLTIAGDSLPLTYRELRIGPALLLTGNGSSGSAFAEGNVSPTLSPLTILRACSTNGLTRAPIDVRLLAVGLN